MLKHPSKQNIKVAVDNCIFTVQDGKLYILLIQMEKNPYRGRWALPGGLIKNSETLDAAAARILREETAVKNIYLEQLYAFSKPDRDPYGRVISAAYFALIPASDIKLRTLPKYADVRFWEFRRLPKLAYDHNGIADYAKKRLAWKLEYSNVAWSLLPSIFTLSDIQKVYEAVLDKRLDKRNFRKKILLLNLLESVKRKIISGAHRPAALYRFRSRKPRIIEVL